MTNKFAQIRGAAWVGFSAVVLAMTVAGSASAGTLDLYHLGEADPGAVAGNPGNNPTIDSGPGGKNLTPGGTSAPTYSSNAAPGSALSMAFNGAGDYTNSSVVTTQTNDVGISAWIYPTVSNNNSIVAYNGNSGNSGFGLFEYNDNAPAGFASISGLLGGITFGPVANIPLNQWSYVTQYLQGGKDTIFLNNVAVGSFTNTPNIPTSSGSNFSIGSGFQGNIDEVRVFTTPEPSSLILCGLGAVGLFVAARRRRKA